MVRSDRLNVPTQDTFSHSSINVTQSHQKVSLSWLPCSTDVYVHQPSGLSYSIKSCTDLNISQTVSEVQTFLDICCMTWFLFFFLFLHQSIVPPHLGSGIMAMPRSLMV